MRTPETVVPKPGVEGWVLYPIGVFKKVQLLNIAYGTTWDVHYPSTPTWRGHCESGPFYKTETDAKIARYLDAQAKADQAAEYAEKLRGELE